MEKSKHPSMIWRSIIVSETFIDVDIFLSFLNFLLVINI